MDKSWIWRLNAQANLPELVIDGDISRTSWYEDEITPKAFKDELEQRGQGGPVLVRINSGGGDPFAGLAIYTALEEYVGEVTVRIEYAASAASMIAMAGNKIEIILPGSMMIHNASSLVWGNKEKLARVINAMATVDESMAQIYAGRSGQPLADIRAMMAAETWFTATEAQEKGFADSIVDYMSERKTTAKLAASAAAEALEKRLEMMAAADTKRAVREQILADNAVIMAAYCK